jgi:MFS family permease
MEQDQLDKGKQAHGRKLFLVEGVLSSIAMRSFIGSLMTAFALDLGANEGQIGAITSVRRVAGFAQLLTNHLMERLGSRRRLYYCVFGTSRTVRILIALLPSIPLAFVSQNVIWWLLFMILIIGCADSMGLVLKKTWMSELTPSGIRGRYFGLRNIFVDSFGMIAGYLGSRYVDHWRTIGKGMFGFQSLFVMGAFLGFLTLIVVAMTPESPSEPKKQTLKAFLRSFQIPFRDRAFAIWTAFRGCYSFGTGFAGPFFSVYLLKELQLPLATVAIYTAIGQIASIVLSRFWGTLADRYGNKVVLVASCVAKSIFPALWIFATGVDTLGAILWLGFVHCVRGFNSAQRITMLNMALWLSPEESRPMYLACESTVVSILSAVSPFLGGLIIGLVAGRYTEISILGWHHTLCAIHVLFLISAILRSASSLILIWVRSDSG